MINLVKKLMKVRIFNFMFVGGIGYIINMGIYYPLTLIMRDQTTIFGHQYYLPPFLISTAIAITSNYFLNKRITFGDSKAKNLSLLKYMGTYWATIPFEMIILTCLVEFLHLEPVVGAAIAILTIFLSRYFVVKKVVWKTEDKKGNGTNREHSKN
jgi:putative flippase GtrA